MTEEDTQDEGRTPKRWNEEELWCSGHSLWGFPGSRRAGPAWGRAWASRVWGYAAGGGFWTLWVCCGATPTAKLPSLSVFSKFCLSHGMFSLWRSALRVDVDLFPTTEGEKEEEIEVLQLPSELFFFKWTTESRESQSTCALMAHLLMDLSRSCYKFAPNSVYYQLLLLFCCWCLESPNPCDDVFCSYVIGSVETGIK